MKLVIKIILTICLFIGFIPSKEIHANDIISLRYDDYYDLTGKTVEIIDAGEPTSYQVGYGVEENSVHDKAVVTIKDSHLVASGIGEAIVSIDGKLTKIQVSAAPISLLLVIGQSNAEGMEGNANQSIACPNGQVYSTYAKANGLTGDAGLTVENAKNYVASSLTNETSNLNVNGTNVKLKDYPIYSLTEKGIGKYGMDSGIAYEWNRQTNEKVWIVNAAHGASSISSWQKGQSNYEEAVALFGACQDVLKKEIKAGHYTFSHMGYYWNQGCADETQTAKWYVDKYLSMHENLKKDLTFDFGLKSTTFEFGNICLVQAGHANAIGYRKGNYEDENSDFFMTYKELEMRGPRVAQIWLANNKEFQDIHLVSTLGFDFVKMLDGSDGVEEYFNVHYENGKVDYKTQVKQSDAWYTPTTPSAVKDSIHYNQIGYNEMGKEAARNTLYILDEIEKPNIETKVKFVNWTGFEEVTNIQGTSLGSSNTLVVPIVNPCYEYKNIELKVNDNLEYNYFDLLDFSGNGGTLSSKEITVNVLEREYYNYSFERNENTYISIKNDDFTENTLMNKNGVFQLENEIILKHDHEWIVEFKYDDSNNRFMVLSSTASSTNGQFYIFKSANNSGVLAIGEYRDGLYHNYGLLQSEVNINWNEPHVIQIRNVVGENSNMIHIYIDGKDMGTATNYIVNGVVKERNSTFLANKDFVFNYVGASGFGLQNHQLEYLKIFEKKHICNWSEWQEVDKSGILQRYCSLCSKIETKEMDGIWEKYDFSNHVSDLPNEFCKNTNLWKVLKHDDEYFYNGTHWAPYTSGNDQVTSVTFKVEPGDQIFASSFERGIRVTYFSESDVLKSLTYTEVQSEYRNNGYLSVPEGASYVNVPMWSSSNDWQLYILNKNHKSENEEVIKPTCTTFGYTKHSCSICHETYQDNYVNATGHEYVDGKCIHCKNTSIMIESKDVIKYQGGVDATSGILNTTFTNNWYSNIQIPKGAEKVRFLTFKTGGKWGSAFFNEKEYLEGYYNNQVGGQWVTLDIPKEATTFRYGYLYDEIAKKNGYEIFEYIEFIGKELQKNETSNYLERPVNGTHKFQVEVNIGENKIATDYGYLILPSNYTSYGEATRLVITCHGAGANINTYKLEGAVSTNYSYLTNFGYAVMDMFASPKEFTGNENGLHYGNPTVLECYKKGYEYVLEHFNIKQDGIYLIGASMGGLSSFQIAQSNEFPVIAQVGHCPVIDLFKQAYVNPWSTASTQRKDIAKYFDFEGVQPTFTNSKYPSIKEIEYYKNNLEKTMAYSPILKNVISGNVDKLFDVIPSSAIGFFDEEKALYDQLTATHPNPLMIFHNLDDTTVSYRYSQYYKEMVERSGQEVILHTYETGGHNAWTNGPSSSVQGLTGTVTLKETQVKTYEFFKKFEEHTEHIEWIDPAIEPTCTTSGLTQGSHCAVCKEVLVPQEIIEALGHEFGEYVYDYNATFEKDGTKSATCKHCGEIKREIVPNTKLEKLGDGLKVTLTNQNYQVISNILFEKLACGPSLVSLGGTKFAVSYLSDEINAVETESSTTIACRLAIFDTEHLENTQYFDIATANQTIGNVKISNKAPYEPNLIKLNDSTLLVLFNLRDTNGNYIYYSATFDLKSNTVSSYQPLTLDNRSWVPQNIASSYNELSKDDINIAGPTSSMVFTSQIIEKDGYYYGYCGGICNKFSGILVRSLDGIHWESILVPEAVSEMKGVIECGFQFVDNIVYLCMRDISSGVYHCSIDFESKTQLTNTTRLNGITTSKPTTLLQENQLYLIVNKDTKDDTTVGRRNTALFYKVDPSTCELKLVKQVFCKDGIAYHSVVNVDGVNYWSFHTDARRINPYTQARSNLAFLTIPNFVEFEEDHLLEFEDYDFAYAMGCISTASNTWQTPAVNYHYQIPLSNFNDYDYVTIQSNKTNKAYIAFFTKEMNVSGTISYAQGWQQQVIMEADTTMTFEIPSDAEYLYILVNNAKGENLLPSKVIFHELLGDIDGNGKINQLDRVVLSRHLAKWNGYESIHSKNADVNLDGKVNQLDRLILSRHLAKWQGYETLPQ